MDENQTLCVKLGWTQAYLNRVFDGQSVPRRIHQDGSGNIRLDSSACPYIWNQARSDMPRTVIDDIEITVRVPGLPRMEKLNDQDLEREDDFRRNHRQSDFYHVPFREHPVSLYCDLAPPTAFVGSSCC